jgi:lipoprotein NlpI
VASLFAPRDLPDAPKPAGKAAERDSAPDIDTLSKQIAAHATMSLYEQRGRARIAHGWFDDATPDFSHALELASTDNDVSRLHAERASSYWFARDWRPALNDFAQAVKRNPANADALEGLGRSDMFAGHSDRAVAELTKAVSLKPDDSVAKLWLFIARSRAGKDAKSAFVESTKNLQNASGWMAQMVAVYRGDATDPALISGSQAAGLSKDACPQEFYLGELSLAKGSSDDARKHFLASRASGAADEVEYVAAGIELGRMK